MKNKKTSAKTATTNEVFINARIKQMLGWENMKENEFRIEKFFAQNMSKTIVKEGDDLLFLALEFNCKEDALIGKNKFHKLLKDNLNITNKQLNEGVEYECIEGRYMLTFFFDVKVKYEGMKDRDLSTTTIEVIYSFSFAGLKFKIVGKYETCLQIEEKKMTEFVISSAKVVLA